MRILEREAVRLRSGEFRRRGWRLASIAILALAATRGSRCLAEPVVEKSVLMEPAGEAFEAGQGAWGVRLTETGAACLYDRVLIEDDGPAIGSDVEWLKTDRAPTTEISGTTRVKKILHLDRPEAKEARLFVPEGVTIEINGRVLPTDGQTQFPVVPSSFLRPGDNEVILSHPGGKGPNLKYATPQDLLRNAPDRQGRPRRSFKSMDGGKTWEPIDGEYMVRLHLVQYAPQGNFISPVIDLGRTNAEESPLLSLVSVLSSRIWSEAETPPGTRVEISTRTGRSPVYEPGLWSDWQAAGTPTPAGNRYLQWKATLSSESPLVTPELRGVMVEAKVDRGGGPSWGRALRVTAFHNEVIRSTSMPFEYENPLHPRMVGLRRKYKLDEVVAGAATETEQLVRLRDWAAHQWKFKVPEENFPAWDADEIMTRQCGFCVQYAIVLMQSAISLGHQARFVFGHNPGAFDAGGHEVCEIWSNEHGKWMFFDVNQNWHYLDPKTRTPMSMLEVHDLIEKTYYPGRPATPENAPTKRIASDLLAIAYGTSMMPGRPPEEFARHFENGMYTVPTRWLFVNYIPRNNFFAQPYPQPKTQGSHWDWSEYWRWEDATTPKLWQYRNYTARRSDLNWTINQVRFDATVSPRPGAVEIQMGTFTPYFQTFRVKRDGEGWRNSGRTLSWKLHPGRNRVEMRSRNNAGIEGPVSFLELDYATGG